MSEVAQVALITGGVGFLSLLITLCFNARAKKDDQEQRAAERRQDNREWYRRTLFERRLAAIHEANSWLQKSKSAINRAKSSDDPESEEKKVLLETVNEAQEWLGKSLMYLYGDMREESMLGGFLLAANSYAQGRQSAESVWSSMTRASDEINDLAKNLFKAIETPEP